MGAEMKDDGMARRSGLPAEAQVILDAFEKVTLSPCQDKRENALFALDQTEKYLRQNATGEAKLAVNEMLRLIDRAKAYGARELDTPVGYRHEDDREVGGEFGSASNDWRVGGAIQATDVALSISCHAHEEKNSFVMLGIKLPEKVSAFGMTDSNFNATIMFFPKNGEAKLTVESPSDAVDKVDSVEKMERAFRLSTKTEPLADFNWGKEHYTIEPTGVTMIKARRL